MKKDVPGHEKRTLVLGVGNPILSDDGVGIHVARILKAMNFPGVEIDELPASGLEALDIIRGYDRVIIIDAIKTSDGKPGDMYLLEEKDFEKAIHGSSPHGINMATAFAMGRKIVPEQMPKEILYFAIEAEDIVNVSEELTEKVAKALPDIVARIEEEIRRRT